MAAADFGGNLIVAKNRTDAGELVGCDHHPEPHSANQDSSLRVAEAHLAGDFNGDVGIIHRNAVENATIDNVVPSVAEHLDEQGPCQNPSVIRAEDDMHPDGPSQVQCAYGMHRNFMLPDPGKDGESVRLIARAGIGLLDGRS